MSQSPDPNRTVDETPRQNPLADSPAPTSDGAPARLELLEEVARGGMGAILRGRDADIGRDVAVKVLLEDHRGRPELAQRFLEEARIAGRLQHPGVVPIYALGQMPDGRPYFTMKLIKGRTLTALLAERKEPAADRPRFLAVFDQVCQTLAYAHAHGVIHRDLKPANIMVGAFGEVQVMDWGLAKVLPRDGEVDEAGPEPTATATASLIQTPRGDSDTGEAGEETQAGSVLGTPAYMAPEQARGEIEDVGVRSDVFGLGAILCEVLTGRPPFVGPKEAALKRARRADLTDALARLDGCGADAEWIDLAKRCLSADAAGRPADAGEVSAEATAYRESVERRLHEAEVANAEARTKAAEGRKRRRLWGALAAVVLLTAVVVGGGWLWVARDRAVRQAKDEWAADVALGQAELAAGHARGIDEEADKVGNVEPETPETAARAAALWRQALGSVEEAERALAAAPDATAARSRLAAGRQEFEAGLKRAEREARLLNDLDQARALRAHGGGSRGNGGKSGIDVESASRSYAAGLAAHGLDLSGPEAESAAAIRRERPAVRLALIVALDDWHNYSRDREERKRLWRIADAADDDAWRRRYRAASASMNVDELKRLAAEARDLELPAVSANLLATTLIGRGARAEGTALLRQTRSRHPTDFWVHFYLAKFLYDPSHPDPAALDEAVGSSWAAIALRPDSAPAHFNLGNDLFGRQDWVGAVACYHKAIDLDPKFTLAYNNLGLALMQQQDMAGAAACYKKVLELDPDVANARVRVIQILALQGRLEEARAAWAAALEHNPSDHDAWYGYAELCLFLGRDEEYRRNRSALLERFGHTADPVVAERTGRACLLLPVSGDDLERAAALADRAAAAGPTHAYYRFFLAAKGLADYRRDRFDAAIDALQQAGARGVWMPVTRPVLAMALYRSGRKREAREALAAAVRSYDWDDNGLDVQTAWIGHVLCREAQELIVPNLSAFLTGEYQPKDNSERLELFDPCRFRKRYLSASRLYADALAADPKLADDALSGKRYNAACSAARTCCGQGEGAKDLDAEERARWRKKGLDWLRADLVLWEKRLQDGKAEDRQAVAATLKHWQQDSDLSGLRDAAELAKLPADEQEAYKGLWADVQALLDKTAAKK